MFHILFGILQIFLVEQDKALIFGHRDGLMGLVQKFIKLAISNLQNYLTLIILG